MKLHLRTSVSIVVFLWASLAIAKFPNNPKPCPYGDSECIKKMINFLFGKKADGYAPLNLVSLDPLKIAEMVIRQGKDSPVGIDLKFQNAELFGFKDAKAVEVKGFGKDITQPNEVVIQVPAIYFLADYRIKGKVLILPMVGSGRCNLTMENARIKLGLDMEPVVKNGETFMHLKNLKMELDVSRLRFDFKNLYNGDKTLGDNTNLFLNENWKDIYGEVRGSIISAFSAVYKSVISNVFDKYPYDQLFV